MSARLNLCFAFVVVGSLCAGCQGGGNSNGSPGDNAVAVSDQPTGVFTAAETLESTDAYSKASRLDDSCYDETGALVMVNKFDDRVHVGQVFTVEFRSRSATELERRNIHATTVKSLTPTEAVYVRDLIGGTQFKIFQQNGGVDSEDETCTIDDSGNAICLFKPDKVAKAANTPEGERPQNVAPAKYQYCYLSENGTRFSEIYEKGLYQFSGDTGTYPAFRHSVTASGKWLCDGATDGPAGTTTRVEITSAKVPVIEALKCRSNAQIFQFYKAQLDDGTTKESSRKETTAIAN